MTMAGCSACPMRDEQPHAATAPLAIARATRLVATPDALWAVRRGRLPGSL